MAIQWAKLVSPHIMKSPKNEIQYERALNKCRSQFRRSISWFNQILDTVEVKQCAQRWSNIDPANVNKFTMMKQKNALLRFESVSGPVDTIDRIQCSHTFKTYFDKNITYSLL